MICQIFQQADGTTKVLKESLSLQAGEVIDATRMNAAALCEFFENEIQDCFDKKLMMSLHMKATMMKVSDPIIFGHWSVSFPALGYWPFLTFFWVSLTFFTY